MPKDILPDLRLADVAELTLAANVQPVSYGMAINDQHEAVLGMSNSSNAEMIAGDGSANDDNGTVNCVNYVQNTSPQIEMANEGLPAESRNFDQMNCHVQDAGSSYFPASSSPHTQQNAAFGFNSQNVLFDAETPFSNVTGDKIPTKESPMNTGSTVFNPQDFIDNHRPLSLRGHQVFSLVDIGMEMAESPQKSNTHDHIGFGVKHENQLTNQPLIGTATEHDHNVVSPYNVDRTSGQNSPLANPTSPHSETQEQNFVQEVTMYNSQQTGVPATNNQTKNNILQQISEHLQQTSSESLRQSNSNTHQTEMNTQQISCGINSQQQLYSSPEEANASHQHQSNFNSPQVSPQQSVTYSPQSQDNVLTVAVDIDQQEHFQNDAQNMDIYSSKQKFTSSPQELNISSQQMKVETPQTMFINTQAGVEGQTEVVFCNSQQQVESSVKPSMFCAVQQDTMATHQTIFNSNIGSNPQAQREIITKQATFTIPQVQGGMNTLQATFAASQVQTGINTQQGTYAATQVQTGMNAQQAIFVAPQVQTGMNTQQTIFAPPQVKTGMNAQQAIFATPQVQTGMDTQQAGFAAPQVQTGLNTQQAGFAATQVRTGMNTQQAGFAAPQVQRGMNTQQAGFADPHVKTGMNAQQAIFATPQVQTGMNAQQAIFATPQVQTGMDTQQAGFAAPQVQRGMNTQQAGFAAPQVQTGMNTQQAGFAAPQVQTGMNTQQAGFAATQVQTGIIAQQAGFAVPQLQTGINTQQSTFTAPQVQTGRNTQQATFTAPQVQTGMNAQQAIFTSPQVQTGMNTQQATFTAPQVQTGMNAQQATFTAPQVQTGMNTQQAAFAAPQVQTGMNTQQAAFAAPQVQTGMNAQQATCTTSQTPSGLKTQQTMFTAPHVQAGSNVQTTFTQPLMQTGINTMQATFGAPQVQTGINVQQLTFSIPRQATFVNNQQQMNSNIQTDSNQQSFFTNTPPSTEMNAQQIGFNYGQQINSNSQTEKSASGQQTFFANAEQVETNVQHTAFGNNQQQNTANSQLQTNRNTQNSFYINAPKQTEGNIQQSVFHNNQQQTNTIPQVHSTSTPTPKYFTNSQQVADLNAQQTIYGNSPHQLNSKTQDARPSNNQVIYNGPDKHFTPQQNTVSQSQAGINHTVEQSNNLEQHQQFANSQKMNTDAQLQNLESSMTFLETTQQTGLQGQPRHLDGNLIQQVQISDQHVTGQQQMNSTQNLNAPSPMDTSAISPGNEVLNCKPQQHQGLQYSDDSAQETQNTQTSPVPQTYQQVVQSQSTVFSNARDVLTGFQTGHIYETQPKADMPKRCNHLQGENAKFDLSFPCLHPNEQNLLNASIDTLVAQKKMDSSNNAVPNQHGGAGQIPAKQDSNVSQMADPMMPPSTNTLSSPTSVLLDTGTRPQVNPGGGFQQYSEHMSEVTFQATDKNNSADQYFQSDFSTNDQVKSAFNFGSASTLNHTVLRVDIAPGQNIPRTIQGLSNEESQSQHVSRSTSGQASPSALDSPHLTSDETSSQLSPSLVTPQTQSQINQFSKALYPRLLKFNSGLLSENNSIMHVDPSQHLSMEHDATSQASLICLSEQLKIEPGAKTSPISMREFNASTNLPEFDEDTMFNINLPNGEESIGVSNSVTNTAGSPSLSFARQLETTSSPFLQSSMDSSRTETTPRSTSITSEPTDESVFLRPTHESPRYKKLTGRAKKMREASLTQQFPARSDGYQLQIVEQPEDQHRARYKTEGSRGSVKDRSQQGHPAVKLIGIQQPVNLQVFVGNDSGKVKPHGFYQACKVCGKTSTPCSEKDIEGTTVIEVQMDPSTDMLARIDCVGILKLRNADVEQRMGLAKAKKKSLKARLVFRVSFKRPDGCYQTLQVASHPILCTQPIGCPEISKKSLSECPVYGEAELFMIGKNFMKGTKVFFEELGENGKIDWDAEGEIDKDYFQNTHLICTVPAYRDSQITSPVTLQVVVKCNNKTSYPMPFTYTPKVKLERMEVECCLNKTSLNKVAPAALHLNEMIAQTTPSSKGLFQLPAGVAQSILADNKGMKMETNQDIKPCNGFSIQTQTAGSQVGDLLQQMGVSNPKP